MLTGWRMAEYHPIGRSFAPGRAIDNGMAAVRLALGPMWLAGLLMGISDGCNMPTQFPSLPIGDKDDASSWLRIPDVDGWRMAATGASPFSPEMLGWIVGIAAVVVVVALTVGIALFAFGAWVHTGFIRLHVNILEHASDAVAPLFSGKDRFWVMAGWKLVAGFSVSAAVLVAAWPGALVAYVGYARESQTMLVAGVAAMAIVALPVVVFVALGVYLGDCVVALENVGPIAALRRAWALARGNRFALFWFAFVCFAVQLVGALGIVLCCVGIVFTMPLAIALTGFAKTESFLLFTRGIASGANWSLWQRRAGGGGATGSGGARGPMPGWEREPAGAGAAEAAPVSGDVAPAATPPVRDPFYRPPVSSGAPDAPAPAEPVRGWTPEPPREGFYRPPVAPAYEPPPGAPPVVPPGSGRKPDDSE
jgi:hypothetical protein